MNLKVSVFYQFDHDEFIWVDAQTSKLHEDLARMLGFATGLHAGSPSPESETFIELMSRSTASVARVVPLEV